MPEAISSDGLGKNSLKAIFTWVRSYVKRAVDGGGVLMPIP